MAHVAIHSLTNLKVSKFILLVPVPDDDTDTDAQEKFS